MGSTSGPVVKISASHAEDPDSISGWCRVFSNFVYYTQRYVFCPTFLMFAFRPFVRGPCCTFIGCVNEELSFHSMTVLSFEFREDLSTCFSYIFRWMFGAFPFNLTPFVVLPTANTSSYRLDFENVLFPSFQFANHRP